MGREDNEGNRQDNVCNLYLINIKSQHILIKAYIYLIKIYYKQEGFFSLLFFPRILFYFVWIFNNFLNEVVRYSYT